MAHVTSTGNRLTGANVLVPFHEVYAVRTHDGSSGGLTQLSYVAFVSQARNEATGALAAAARNAVRGIIVRAEISRRAR